MENDLTPIHFIAQIINDHRAKEKGYIASTRWLVTREDIKAECLAEAERLFNNWKEEEINASKDRDVISNGLKIKYINKP